MYKALLISYVNWDSLIEIPVLLNKGGCTVDVFCTKGSWAVQNSFFEKWIEGSPDSNIFITQLLEYIDKNGRNYDWIIPGDDAVLRLLNEKIISESLFYQIMPLSKIENRELLGSKAGFSNLCAKYGLKTPRFLIYKDGMTPAEIENHMQFPFLMKVDKSEGGYGVFLCHNENDLVENFAKITNKENLVFQQFIKGYDINVEVLYKEGGLLVYSYSRTLKIMGKFGPSTQRIFYSNTDIEPELFKIGRTLGVNGFGNVVFMYNELDNTHYLIEVDVRPNAWMYYGKFMGNDFSESVRRIVKGDLNLVKPAKEFENKRLKITLYKKDIHRCILEKDIKGLLEWAINKEFRWRYIPFYDFKLLFACKIFLVKFFWEMVGGKLKKIMGRS